MTSKNENEEEINEWLNKREAKVLQKFWIVISALSDEWQIRDQDAFKIPYHKLKAIDDPKDLEGILSSLHNKR